MPSHPDFALAQGAGRRIAGGQHSWSLEGSRTAIRLGFNPESREARTPGPGFMMPYFTCRVSSLWLQSSPTMSDTTAEGGKDTDTEWKKSSARFTSKRYSEYFDPCQEAADRSLKCLRRNGGDRAMCMDYFDAYKACKKQWMDEMKEQKRREGKGWFS